MINVLTYTDALVYVIHHFIIVTIYFPASRSCVQYTPSVTVTESTEGKTHHVTHNAAATVSPSHNDIDDARDSAFKRGNSSIERTAEEL